MRLFPKLVIVTCMVSVFLVSTAASTEIKVSKVGGAYQIWWEAEDFDERDAEDGYQLGKEAQEFNNQIKITEGFFGTDVTMFPKLSDRNDLQSWYGLYNINLPSGAPAGTWYFWVRISFVGPSGDMESHHLWVLNDPGDGNAVSKERPVGEIDDADDRLFADVPDFPMGPEWAWHGRNTVMEGLDKELQAGKNVIMIWERESDFDSVYMDVIMCTNDIAYRPTDKDYENAGPAAVRPGDKLPLTWGRIKLEVGD